MQPQAADAAHAATLVLRDGVILLGVAMLFVTLFRRFGLGAVLGYLVAGALVGPHGLGVIDAAPEAMLRIADLGIVLLLFLVGLELHPSRLWRLKSDIFGLGLLQVVVSGVALAGLVHFATGLSWAAAVAIGRSASELAEARDALAAYLREQRDDPGDWPGLSIFREARAYKARHPSILLAFEAVAEAARQATR